MDFLNDMYGNGSPPIDQVSPEIVDGWTLADFTYDLGTRENPSGDFLGKAWAMPYLQEAGIEPQQITGSGYRVGTKNISDGVDANILINPTGNIIGSRAYDSHTSLQSREYAQLAAFAAAGLDWGTLSSMFAPEAAAGTGMSASGFGAGASVGEALGAAGGSGLTFGGAGAGFTAAAPTATSLATTGLGTLAVPAWQQAGMTGLKTGGVRTGAGILSGENTSDAVAAGAKAGAGAFLGDYGGMLVDDSVGKLAGNATRGGISSAMSGQNVGKGALAGGISGYTPDVSSELGITNPIISGTLNGATSGALSAKVRGGNTGLGAIMGGTMGGLDGLDKYSAPQSGYQAINPSRSLLNDINQMSTVPSANGYSSLMSSSSGMNYTPGPEYSSNGAYTAPELQGSSMGSSWSSPDLGDFMGKILPSSARGWGDLAGSALGMYGAYKQRKMARDLQSQIGGNRKAYQTQLTRDLQRRDAASGRRSNYAGRATELQSSLAQLDSRNAPALAQLQQAELGGLLNMFNTGMRYGDKAGWFGSPNTQQQPTMQPQQPLYLPSMIGQQQGPQDYSLDQQRKIKLRGYGG